MSLPKSLMVFTALSLLAAPVALAKRSSPHATVREASARQTKAAESLKSDTVKGKKATSNAKREEAGKELHSSAATNQDHGQRMGPIVMGRSVSAHYKTKLHHLKVNSVANEFAPKTSQK